MAWIPGFTVINLNVTPPIQWISSIFEFPLSIIYLFRDKVSFANADGHDI